MKRKLLFSTAMLVVAASAMAQNDITPSRYDFANQPEGQYVIDGCNNGWGPGNLDAAKESKVGYVNVTGGTFWANKDTESFVNFQSGLQILDLTEEGIGKVLCFKGVNCTEDILPKGVCATGSIKALWPQLAFYSDIEKTPTGEEGSTAPFIRVSVTHKAIENEADPEGSPLTGLEIKAVKPNAVLNNYGGPFPSTDMTIKDLETEEAYELNEGWQKVEYDFQVGTPEGNPFAFSVKINGVKLDAGAILIKEIKFSTPSDGSYPKGSPKVEKKLTFKGGQIVTGINTPKFEGNKVRCDVSNTILTISNLESDDKVEVYSILGTLISSQKATSDVLALPLNGKGIFIVKTNTATTKVVNN